MSYKNDESVGIADLRARSSFHAQSPRPPEKGSPRFSQRPTNFRVSNRVSALTVPAKREFTVEPLDVDTLRPLIDLAYWSTFLGKHSSSHTIF